MASTYYAPSEAAIEAAIEKRVSSAGFFQRVAEQLARGIYPGYAAGIVPFGRRSDDKTVPGWPDAYLTKSNGSLIAIEATTASDARTGHWPDDLTKLEGRLEPNRRGGLIWVAWDNPSDPTDAIAMREQARQLGIPTEDVHIVFKKELCARLRAPVHARFWINDLGLHATAGPFDRVEDVIARVNTRRSPSIFPTVEEYREDRVYAPPVLGDIERALASQRAALVVGHGAAGKTTLAMVLSHRPRHRDNPAYYLDLTTAAADPTLIERTGEALAALADQGVLFIVDNAHLEPSATVRLQKQWEAFGSGSELFILTRRVRAKTEPWSDEPELESSPVPNFDLVIQPSDLEGVYRRHYGARNGADPASVQADVLARWHELFGGDLLVFSAAVLGLLDSGRDTTDLQVSDARAFVHRRYLANPDFASELPALLDLAAVAEVEGLMPIEAVPEGALRACIRQGLVWVEARGSKRHYHVYRLAHPGLGTLLRDAAGCSPTSRETRCRVLQAHAHACVATATGLNKNGKTSEAVALLEALWRNSRWPLAEVPLSWWPGAQTLAATLRVVSAEELSTRVVQWLTQPKNSDALVKQALATPLNDLVSFLTYADRAMPGVAKAVRDGLATNSDALVKQALATPLNDLASFLTYADRAMPGIAKAVRDGLATNSDALVKQALAAPLHFLASFLTYADRAMPEVAKAVRDGLATNSDALVKQALATPLSDLASFLTYADRAMPEVAKAVRDGLATNSDALVKQALATPLSDLASFLTYADRAMPEVAKAVRDGLATNSDALVKQALATPLSDLVSFLTYADRAMSTVGRKLRDALLSECSALVMATRTIEDGPERLAGLFHFDQAFTKILPLIDSDTWSRRWRDAAPGQPHWFIGFAGACYRAGQHALVGPIAEAIIRNATDEDFPSPSITIRHLSFILTSPHRCGAREIDDFFARCLPSDWVAAQYLSPDAMVGTLAGSVRAVTLDDREWIRSHFCHPALLRRVEMETPTSDDPPRHVAEWLQLFSATQLLGIRIGPLRSLSSTQLLASLEVLPPGPPDVGINTMQAGLWAGLMEWCHLTGECPTVDATLAEGILAQFRAADPAGRPRMAALNAIMIEWLERCQSQGWCLVVERDSIADALNRQIAVATSKGTGLESPIC